MSIRRRVLGFDISVYGFALAVDESYFIPTPSIVAVLTDVVDYDKLKINRSVDKFFASRKRVFIYCGIFVQRLSVRAYRSVLLRGTKRYSRILFDISVLRFGVSCVVIIDMDLYVLFAERNEVFVSGYYAHSLQVSGRGI